jgi:hypothetical protein
VSKPQVFGLGYMLGALIAITAALGAIAHETRRADARNHKEPRDVQLRAVQPARDGHCRSLRAT